MLNIQELYLSIVEKLGNDVKKHGLHFTSAGIAFHPYIFSLGLYLEIQLIDNYIGCIKTLRAYFLLHFLDQRFVFVVQHYITQSYIPFLKVLYFQHIHF